MSGINLGDLFSKTTQNISAQGSDLEKKMVEISSKDEVSQGEMLDMQFAMGQYNAKMEVLSSVMKSMQDMLKSLAQRTG